MIAASLLVARSARRGSSVCSNNIARFHSLYFIAAPFTTSRSLQRKFEKRGKEIASLESNNEKNKKKCDELREEIEGIKAADHLLVSDKNEQVSKR